MQISPTKFVFRYLAPAEDLEFGGGGGGADVSDSDADDSVGEAEAGGAEGDAGDGESEEDEPPDDDEGGDEAEESLTVVIDGEPAGAEEDEDISDMTPKARKRWAEMRIQLRNEKRARKEAEERIAAAQQPPAAPSDPGPEPKIDDEDIAYDTDVFASRYRDWASKKSAAEAEASRRIRAQEEEQKAWSSRLESYAKSSAKLGAADFSDAEETVKGALSVVQQGIILKGSKRAAEVVYALGKSPKHLAKVASIQDPVEFAFAVADLETKMTVTTRKNPPAPERAVKSSVAGAAAVDNQLERLREAARRTGDYSKVMEHRRIQEEKARKKAAA